MFSLYFKLLWRNRVLVYKYKESNLLVFDFTEEKVGKLLELKLLFWISKEQHTDW